MKADPEGTEKRGRFAGMRPEERKAFRRSQILEAGIRVIGTQGYDAATVKSVCAEADLTERYFYESFINKDDLCSKAYTLISEELKEAITIGVVGGLQEGPRGLIRSGITAAFKFIQAHPDRARLLMIESLAADAATKSLISDNIDNFANLIIPMADPYLNSESPPKPIVSVMLRGAMSAVIGLFQYWLLTEQKQPIEELIDGTERIFLGMVDQLNVKI